MRLVVRSTSVPIAERCNPMIRSPSQCPGTARSAASAGRWLISVSLVTCAHARCFARARGTRSARPVRKQLIYGNTLRAIFKFADEGHTH